MLTRTEELQKLREMKTKISSINNMQNKIDEMNDRIIKESNRPMQVAPDYSPSHYYEWAKDKVRDKRENIIKKIVISFYIIFCVFSVISLIYLVMNNVIKGWVGGIFYLLSYVSVYGVVLISIDDGFDLKNFAAGFDLKNFAAAFFGNFILHLILGGFGVCGEIYNISVVMSILFIAIYAVAYLIITISLAHYLVDGKRKDEEDKKQYEIDLQKNESKLIEQNKRIELEKKQNIEKYNNCIDEYKRKITREITLLNAIPGLAVQDKNEYTVNTLITYFERGKADSIKEAINLFDAEERDRRKREEQNAWNRIMLEEQMRAEREKKELIEKQGEENQRRYNELRRIENERNKKVDEFIKETKRKLEE